MITRVNLLLQLPENAVFRQNMAYSLYGMLCDRMDPVMAEAFHTQAITPIRQHVEFEGGRIFRWTVDLFGEAEVLATLLQNQTDFKLESFSEPLAVLECTILNVPDISSLLAVCHTWPEETSSFQMIFKTPCTFKVAGTYAQFPSVAWIAQSLFQRWNALIPDCAMDGPDALHLLTAGLEIRRYRLMSRDYWLKGQRISGFTGSILLSARLPAPMMQLLKLLLAFAPYSGIGIKTTLGMGAVDVIPCARHLFKVG